MILMYHDIGPRESTWTRTPENLKKDLATLYSKGYRPISLTDLVQNRISTPAGLTPVVITFDDGHRGQFDVVEEDGKIRIRPTSAVAILVEFNSEHPDFPLESTFFLHGNTPFEQPAHIEFKLNYLVEHGMDIGNHSTGHQNLAEKRYQNTKKIQKAIGAQAHFLQTIIKDDTYRVNTLALCFGQSPRQPVLKRYLKTGLFDGEPYENIAVLLVGANPAPAPIHRDFNPMRLPRIRASATRTENVGLYDWLRYYDKHPEARFISDGDHSTVTVHKKDAKKMARERLMGKSIIILDN